MPGKGLTIIESMFVVGILGSRKASGHACAPRKGAKLVGRRWHASRGQWR